MVYFAKGDAVWRSTSPSVEPLEVLKADRKVNNVAVNTSESLMAVFLENTEDLELAVYVFRHSSQNAIPTLHKLELKPIVCKKSKIIGMFWDPVAYLDAGLVVLTESTLYNIYCPPSVNNTTSVEEISLQGEYGLKIDACGISKGSPESPLGILTTYISTSDDDIYRLMPFVPRIIGLTNKQLRASAKFDPSLLEKFSFRYESWCDRQKQKILVLERESVEYARYSLPLALKLEPFPIQFYDEQVYQHVVGSFGLNTDVIVQTSAHYVNFWAIPSPLADSATLVGSVKFKHSSEKRVEEVTGNSVIIECKPSGDRYIIVCNSQFKDKLSAIKLDGSPESEKAVASALSSQKAPLQSQSITYSPKLVNPDFTLQLLTRLSKYVESNNNHPPPSVELGGNAQSLIELDGLAANFQSRSSELIKLTADLRTERRAQQQEATRQQTEALKLLRLGESIALTQSKQSDHLKKLTTRQQTLDARLKTVKEKIIKLAALGSTSPPQSGAKEAEWFKSLRNEDPKKLEDLDESIKKLDALYKHVKALPPWHMLDGSEEPITLDQQHELRRELAAQAKQIGDLELLTL